MAMSGNLPQAKNAVFAPSEPLAERLVHMVVSLATELAVTHERVDTLERMLGKAEILNPECLKNPDLDAEAEEARRLWRERFLDRIFQQLQSEIATAEKDSSSGGKE